MSTVQMLGKSRCTVGRHTYGLETLQVMEWGEGMPLSIGSFCSFAIGVEIMLGGQHRADYITTYPFGFVTSPGLNTPKVPGHPMSKGGVTIGNDVWLGRSCRILNGVTIGDGAVIGSFAVVTKDVPAYAIVAGNPAKLIRFRFPENIIALLQELRWWELPDNIINTIAMELCQAPTEELLTGLINKYRR